MWSSGASSASSPHLSYSLSRLIILEALFMKDVRWLSKLTLWTYWSTDYQAENMRVKLPGMKTVFTFKISTASTNGKPANDEIVQKCEYPVNDICVLWSHEMNRISLSLTIWYFVSHSFCQKYILQFFTFYLIAVTTLVFAAVCALLVKDDTLFTV